MSHHFASTCQACGAPLHSVHEHEAWLCADCLEEREQYEEDEYNDLYQDDCEQCGGPARDGFCPICQA